MIKNHYSLKLIIATAMIAMIVLVYALIFRSAETYRELAVDNQTEALQSLLAVKSQDIVDQSRDAQRNLALTMQGHAQFLKELNQKDKIHLEAWMLQYFAEQIGLNPELKLKAIIVRNLRGEVISQASDTDLPGFHGCPASQLNTIELKSKFTLCEFDSRYYSEVMVPVNRFKPIAFIQILVDIVDKLKQLEDATDLPLLISDLNGNEIYRSEHWPDTEESQYLKPEHRLFSGDHLSGVDIVASFDQRPFISQLDRAQTNLLITAGIASMGVMLVLLVGLIFAFRPLHKLRNSVGAMLSGKYSRIEVENLPNELHDLIIAYNDMVEGLESEIMSRRKIEEKFRSEKDFIITTLNSIPNPVIVIDSKERIKLLNPSAEVFLGEKESKLVEKPIEDFMILYSNEETTRIVDISKILSQKKAWTTMYYHHPERRVVELEFLASPMIDLETEDVSFVIVLKDVSEDRQLRRKLSYEGSHDQLTGALNRTAFEQKFETIVVEGSGSQQHVLAYLDIDQFKVINESCGNAAGDRLLKLVAAVLSARVRRSDIVARLSADEFGIIMPYFEIRPALEVMQKIIIDIQHAGFMWQNREYLVTASIGIMMFGRIQDEFPDFHSRVTTACQLAKENGGNQYHFIDKYDEKIEAQQQSLEWVSSILQGFTEDRFCLYVQPIVSINPEEDFSHFEVLIRYRRVDGTIVEPNDFLPPAERYNLIERIDSWVVKEIITWLQDNRLQVSDKVFSINLSGRSIGSDTFHQFLRESLVDSELDLSNLCFEISETAAVDNIEKSVEFITSIKKFGAKIALDDFGTGLSSFSYLKQFPVDYLKIDGEFIRDIIEDDKSFVFVRSMTELGHCLDMKVIAEFVESDTMFDRLRDANVDYIQGYTVGKPVDIKTLLEA
ncbi:MAG: EAL domain-containing protein [Gammaproteobacteria bacterium]|nr:EAL domain-containing protein [Gammaproteobacteria bacterium]